MGRTVIVGDVHGCFEELVELLELVGLTPRDRLVGVGDLVDRGPDPRAVVELFRTRPNTVAVMGNHERKHVRGVFSYSQEITRLQLGSGYAEAVEWMSGLPYFYDDGEVRVVHAAMVPGVAWSQQLPEVLCGSARGERELRERFGADRWHDHYDDPVPIVFGHHVTGDEPLVRSGLVYGLDTGACHGGRLTALCVPGFTIHSVPARADHWARVRRQWQLPVLRTRPWLDYSWPKLEESVARFGDGADTATREWLDTVESWARELRGAHPAMLAAAHRWGATLEPEVLGGHPAAPVLFRARAGRLGDRALEQQCATPRATMRLAQALAVPVPDFPG